MTNLLHTCIEVSLTNVALRACVWFWARTERDPAVPAARLSNNNLHRLSSRTILPINEVNEGVWTKRHGRCVCAPLITRVLVRESGAKWHGKWILLCISLGNPFFTDILTAIAMFQRLVHETKIVVEVVATNINV